MDNRQIVLEQIPQGKLTPQHFRLQTTPAPTPGDGGVLVRTRYRQTPQPARVEVRGREAFIYFPAPHERPAPGQLAVIYDQQGLMLAAGIGQAPKQ